MGPVGSSVMLELFLAVHSYHVIAYLEVRYIKCKYIKCRTCVSNGILCNCYLKCLKGNNFKTIQTRVTVLVLCTLSNDT